MILSPEVLWLGLECHIGERLRFVSLIKVQRLTANITVKNCYNRFLTMLFLDYLLTTLSQWCSIKTVRLVTLQGGQFSFSKNNNVNFIDIAEWIPKSPDAAQMDFGI